jgi:arylsulfatase A-like enzyme
MTRLAIFLVLVAAGVAEAVGGPAEQPNILFMLTDDQRWDCMGCAGHPYLQTPNLDRVAGEGCRFANAFVTTSLCSPSRASFLTGQYARVHGVTNNNYEINFARHPTFPEYLQKAGYDTAYVGKWHMGWDDRWRPGYNTWISYQGQGEYFDQPFTYNGVKIPTTGYNTDVTTSFALAWLRQKRDKPFMLFLSYKAPHQPWTPAPRDKGLYADRKWEPPEAFWAPLDGKPDYVIKHGQQASTRPAQARRQGLSRFVQQYSETIKGIDENVGLIVQALQEMGILDKTAIFFAGDNGYFFQEHRLGDKRAMYEPSMRIPLLVRYPKLIKPGTVINEMVLNIDLAPTLLELAGIEVPAAMQGRSMVRLVQGGETRWREAFLYEYLREEPYMYPTVYGVRTPRLAYMHYPELQGQDELYDLVADAQEIKNVIQDPARAEDLEQAKRLLDKLEKEAGERAPANTIPDTGNDRMGKSRMVPDR